MPYLRGMSSQSKGDIEIKQLFLLRINNQIFMGVFDKGVYMVDKKHPLFNLIHV